MKSEILFFVDLIQSILILFGVLGFYLAIGKAVTPTPPAAKIEEVILELEEDVSDVWNGFLDEVPDVWREILIGSVILVSLILLGLLSYMVISRLTAKSRLIDLKETATTTPRHLLDLSQAERLSYIEAKEKGDLEVTRKILEGCGCKEDAECSDDDGYKKQMKMIN